MSPNDFLFHLMYTLQRDTHLEFAEGELVFLGVNVQSFGLPGLPGRGATVWFVTVTIPLSWGRVRDTWGTGCPPHNTATHRPIWDIWRISTNNIIQSYCASPCHSCLELLVKNLESPSCPWLAVGYEQDRHKQTLGGKCPQVHSNENILMKELSGMIFWTLDLSVLYCVIYLYIHWTKI